MSHATSVQMELIQGKCEDIYYANPEITKKSCIPTKQTTKYVQSFNSLSEARMYSPSLRTMVFKVFA